MDVPVRGNKLYDLALYLKGGEFLSFNSQWSQVRLLGKRSWMSLDDYRLNLVEPKQGNYIQFRTVVVWNPDEDEEEIEEWRVNSDSGRPDRVAIITVDIREIAAVREIYWNKGEEIPGFGED